MEPRTKANGSERKNSKRSALREVRGSFFCEDFTL